VPLNISLFFLTRFPPRTSLDIDRDGSSGSGIPEISVGGSCSKLADIPEQGQSGSRNPKFAEGKRRITFLQDSGVACGGCQST
jgi:hypothetical protein